MKNIAVVNATGLRPTTLRPLAGGASALERAVTFGRALPGVEEVVLLLAGPLPKTVPALNLRTIERAAWTSGDLLETLATLAEGREDLFYFFGDCPLLDSGLAARMHASHRRYFADYTFADGFPVGLAPEILQSGTPRRLRSLAGDGPLARAVPDRQTIFTVLKMDINSFDVETELSPVDLRMMRAFLCADTERNFLLLTRVLERGGRDAATACRVLQESPEILRTLPAWFPIQIVEGCPQSCSYCPYPVLGGDPRSRQGVMPKEAFSALLEKIESFAGQAVVGISLWGEPALHPQIEGLIAEALSRPGIDLVVETSAVGWKPGAFQVIRGSSPRAPTWIVSLDAASQAVYGTLRGDGFGEALAAVESLQTLFPATTWVQAVRMKENEEDLEAFYKAWKSRTENLIIQKYDSFCGMLPERRVADLSPVTRFPCWHLMRDFPILLDGTVPLCREELRRGRVLGNAQSEDLAAIWDRGAEVHRSHLRREYPGLCAGCDEYYTYNF